MDQDIVALARAIVNKGQIDNQASIIASGAERQTPFVVQTFALDTAQLITDPKEVGFPFQSVYVSAATDQNVSISMSLADRSAEGMNNAVALSQNGGFNLPSSIFNGFMYWPAQAGKTITLVFLRYGTFNSGKIVNVTSGGIQVSEGTTVTTRTVASLPTITGTRGIILPALATRVSETLYNGDLFPYYLGDATVTVPSGASPGIPLLPGASMIWKNTAALYAITDGSTVALASRTLES